MKVQHYLPSSNLQHLIASFWTLRSEASDRSGTVYRFVLDGSIDWIFHLETPWKYHFPTQGAEKIQHTAHIFGQWKNYLDLYLPENALFLLGVKFHPWAARMIWKKDMHELTDQEVVLSDLDLPEMALLEEQIHLGEDIPSMIGCIETYLSKWQSIQLKQDVPEAIRRIHKTPSKFSVSSLNIQPRRLEQRFREEIGISPKHYQRIIRVNQAIQKMIKNPYGQLTSLAYELGYYDQSHFIRDFKNFTGLAPSRFMRSTRPEGDILNLRIA